jgi:hypothetical protein
VSLADTEDLRPSCSGSEGEVMYRFFRILEGAFLQTVGSKRDGIPMWLAAATRGVQRVCEVKKLWGLSLRKTWP